MNIFMLDSVNTDALPAAPAYAAYVNGEFANWAAVASRFSYCRVLGIDVLGNASTRASILDYEPGDVQSIPNMVQWCQDRNAFRPGTATVYCDRSELAEVDDGLAGKVAQIWLATLDGTDINLVGTLTPHGHLIVGVQAMTVGTGAGAYDVSYVMSSWVFG